MCVRVFPNNFMLSMNVRLCFHVDGGENRMLTCPSPSSATSAAVEAVASVWTFTLRMVENDRCQSHGEEVKLLLTGDCGQGKQGKQGEQGKQGSRENYLFFPIQHSALSTQHSALSTG